MKRLILFISFLLCVANGYANCDGCGEWVDSDVWCSECHLCFDCAYDQGLHCQECEECLTEIGGDADTHFCSGCGECLESVIVCEVCGEDHCQTCGQDYQCLWCGKCMFEEEGFRCDGCIACEDTALSFTPIIKRTTPPTHD